MGIDFPGFEVGIQDALRQSPDYIVIGEIRTLSALKAAISAAEAGHGIIGTIHSIGAARTLTRMLSMFSEAEKEFIRYQLSANLNFILSQKLTYNDRKAHLDYELMLNIPSMENTIREGRFNQMDNLILLGEKQGDEEIQCKIKRDEILPNDKISSRFLFFRISKYRCSNHICQVIQFLFFIILES